MQLYISDNNNDSISAVRIFQLLKDSKEITLKIALKFRFY